ncbi:MAG: hypothetical protein M1826_002622 [Phylliscum demangeonii]|nr:MAG: hypothetical protein M1826_002622 [Phylliscum demangeonii]
MLQASPPTQLLTIAWADDGQWRAHRGGHRPAPPAVLSTAELIELRAIQRTFEGAYVRTALSQLSFALVVLRIFTAEFYSIGALFAAYGCGILLVSLLRRRQGSRPFLAQPDQSDVDGSKRFRTSGNVVLVLVVLTVAAYVSLMSLIMRL